MSTQTNSIAEAKSIPSKKEIIRMMQDFDSQLPELLAENWKPVQ